MSEAVREETWRRARLVLALFLATVGVGVLLLVAFEPEVQTVDAGELIDRKDDARAFLAADYVFIALYAICSPIAIWTFGTAVGHGAPPLWAKAAALVPVISGALDVTENTLLLAATGSLSEKTVDAAHVVAVPLLVFFVLGIVSTVGANVVAARVLRRHRRR